EPEVAHTPPTGVGLTHRVAVHLKPGLTAKADATPRATAEPALDDWLARVLPSLDKIQCQVVWKDPITSADESESVSFDMLGINPIDCLSLINPDQAQNMTELDDRILSYVIGLRKPRPDAVLTIQYMASTATG